MLHRGNTHSEVYDSGATSNFGREEHDFILTNQKSNKVFHMPTGNNTPSSAQAKLRHDVCDPFRTVDIVPALKHNLLLRRSKFSDAKYGTVLTPIKVIIYDGNNLTIQVSSEDILRG